MVLVGNGERHFAQAFREDLRLDATVLIDPELTTYRAAGLRRGRVELLSPRVPLNAARALWGGARQQGVQGDPWQLGGIFVLNPQGDLLYRHVSREAGDHPPAREVLDALDHAQPVPTRDETPSAAVRLAGSVLGRVVDPTIVFSFDRTGFALRSLAFSPADLDVDLSGRRWLVTGANSGIGRESALALADLGAEVVLLCRNAERGTEAARAIREETGNSSVHARTVDMSDLASVRDAAQVLAAGPVDGLIHNAGVLPDQRTLTEEGLELTLATHVVGPHVLTRLLQPAFARSRDARVLWVTSGGMYASKLDAGSMLETQGPYDGVSAYSMTKRAQVVLAELWSEELAGTAVVNSMHPGWADTPSVRSSLPTFHRLMRPLLRTAAEGADTLVWLAASSEGARHTGRLFLDREPRRTHYLPFTRESQRERELLWSFCEDAAAKSAKSHSLPRGA